MKLKDLEVGSLVKCGARYNGEEIIMQILEHGHEGDPEGSTTLVSRDIITQKCFDAKEPKNSDLDRQKYGNNRYSQSNLLQWLNSDNASWFEKMHNTDQKPDSDNVHKSGTTATHPYDTEAGFLTNFSAELKAVLQTVSKMSALNTVTDGGGYETVSSKIFLLSMTEIGLENENSVTEGSIYKYYSNSNTNDRRKKNIRDAVAKGSNANSQVGNPHYWWLRTPRSGYTGYIWVVDYEGKRGSNYVHSGYIGVIPAFCIPQTLKVSDSTDDDGCYVVDFPVLKIEGSKGSLGTINSYTYNVKSDKSRARAIPFTIRKAPSGLSLDKTETTLTSSAPTSTITCTAHENATITAESSDTSVVTVSVSGNKVTISGVNETNGTAIVSITSSETTNYERDTKEVAVTAQFVNIYGVEWDGSSDPAWSRTDSSANFTDPVPYVAGATSYGSPFDDIYPWSGMEKVEDSEAGTLVKIPKYYYKWTIDGSKMKLQISDEKLDGFLVSPAHADRGDGKGERDYVYIGRYHCALNTYKSTTGVMPHANVTRANFRTSIHNLGSTIWQNDFAMRWTIQMLYLVEFAHWNSQDKIGRGCSPSGSKVNMGYTDSMPYHTGTDQSSRDTYGGTQYRYIEGLWDNVYDWCDGIYFRGADVYCIKNPADFSDTTGGTKTGTRATSSNEIKAYSQPSVEGFEYALYPSEVVGNSNYDTYVCDRCLYNSSGVVLFVGGYYSQGLFYGLFFLGGSGTASSAFQYIGSRLQKLP